jgi:hypothetical protein
VRLAKKRARANILPQLGSEHSWLASYGKRIKKGEDDKYKYGARETTTHVLVDCLKLYTAMEKLRKRIRIIFNSLSLTPGGIPYTTLAGYRFEDR